MDCSLACSQWRVATRSEKTTARMGEDLPTLAQALFAVNPATPSDLEVLQVLGLPGGFEPMAQEDAEFMIDLMDTLLD